MSLKTCKYCKEKFERGHIITSYCSPLCEMTAKAMSNLKAIKQDRAKAKREYKANDKSRLLKKAQSVFNKWIRERDGEKCISCNHTNITALRNTRQFHAGHYLTTGARPELRFNEDNCHSQCSICNNYLSGNLAQYRLNLINKIGLERVEALENARQVKKWTVDELKEIIEKYQS